MTVVKVPRRKPKQKKVHLWPQTLLEWVIVLAMAATCLVAGAQSLEPVRKVVSNPWFFAMLAALILEFLLIKSGDRSRVYQKETQHLQKAQDRWNLARGRTLEALEEAERLWATNEPEARRQAADALQRAKRNLLSR